MGLPPPNLGHKITILVSMIVTFSCSPVSASLFRKINCPIDSIYQIGDSLADTGNYVRITPLAPASRSPYGETFPKLPTGRWSDGLLLIDFLATSVGVPLLKPYLSHDALSFQHGVNFAVAGSTGLGSLFYTKEGIKTDSSPSLLDQLGWFKEHLKTICLTPTDCKIKLSRSVVIMGEFGANDIRYALSAGRSIPQIQNYLSMIRVLILSATKDVISSGASQAVVPGLLPFGCFPFIRGPASKKGIFTAYDGDGCVKDLNDIIASWNIELQVGLELLRKEFPLANILYADLYNPYLLLLRSAPILGFNQLTLFRQCCGVEEVIIDPAIPTFCGNLGVPVCPNPNAFISWDGIHLTQEAYRHIADNLIRDLGFHCPN